VVDLSNPSNPVRVGGYSSEAGYLDLAVCGGYLYGAFGDATYSPPPPAPPGPSYGGLLVLDLGNPTNLVAVSSYQTNTWPLGVGLSTDYAYLVGGVPRLQVIDISDPRHVTLATNYAADGYQGSPCSVVARGNYALLANNSEGLEILWVGPPQPARLTAPRTGSQVRLSWPVSASGFLLQGAPGLSAPQWQVMPVTPQVQGESYTVTVPASGTSSFFRLWHP
jgi:hypothetical protein